MRSVRSIKIIFMLTSLFFISCNLRFFVNKNSSLFNSRGIIIFADDTLTHQHTNGDVFTDSLIPGFFVKYNFKQRRVKKEEIVNALFIKKTIKADFFYQYNNCNNEKKSFLITQSENILTDNRIDSFLKSSKLYLVPVDIEYRKLNYRQDEYKSINKFILINYNQKSIKVEFNDGHYYVTRVDLRN